MTNEEKYNMLFETLQERVNNHEITLEYANEVNDMAYDKYIVNGDVDYDELETLEQVLDTVDRYLESKCCDINEGNVGGVKKYASDITNLIGGGKESTDSTMSAIDALKLHTFEACEAGEIDVAMKNEILEKIDNVVEAYSNDLIDEDEAVTMLEMLDVDNYA